MENNASQGTSSSQNKLPLHPTPKFVKVILPPSNRHPEKNPRKATRTTTSKKRNHPESSSAPSSSNLHQGEPKEKPSLASMKRDLLFMQSKLEKEGHKVEAALKSHLEISIRDLLRRIAVEELFVFDSNDF